MSEPLGIALLGCGTVGSGVASLLIENANLYARRAGRPIEIRHIVVRDAKRARSIAAMPTLFTTDLNVALADPRVQVVVELVGGVAWAKDAIMKAMAAGKHVVTANKALLAEQGTELFADAHRNGRAIAFEASVAGGIPIIGAIVQSLAGNRIRQIQGILNGTCNYILSAMTDQHSDYAAALAEAQRLGFAEADPALDVDGSDAAHKLAVLCRVAFGAAVPPGRIERRGITNVSPLDIHLAKELGYVIRLIAEAQLHEDHLTLRVEPVLVRCGSMLAGVVGPDNAVRLTGDAVGELLFRGAGAGALPTASAVVADIIDFALGRAQSTFQAMRLWVPTTDIRLSSAADETSRFFVRLTVEDQPGVLAEVAGLMAMEQISIAEVIQHEAAGDHRAALVVTTHPTIASRLTAALRRIEQSTAVLEPAAFYAINA